MAVKKVVEEAVYEDLMAELLATVTVPGDLPVAPGLVLSCPTKDQLEAINAAVTEEDAQKVIFGDDYNKAQEIFGGKPVQIWNAFMKKWNLHFFAEENLGK